MGSGVGAVAALARRLGNSNSVANPDATPPGPAKSMHSDSLDYAASNESPGTISQKYPSRLTNVMKRATRAAPELPLSVLRAAYADGWFPMGERGTRAIEWFSPDPRGILPLTGFHLPARLGRTLRAGRFEIRVDTAFAAVMDRCAERDDTWISEVIRESYQALHAEGEAHSVECWREDRLVGGLYGVALGGVFFGESMFHVETDASKVALAALVDRLRARDFALLDLQWVTPHLAQFGATEIRRSHYLRLLRQALSRRCDFV